MRQSDWTPTSKGFSIQREHGRYDFDATGRHGPWLRYYNRTDYSLPVWSSQVRDFSQAAREAAKDDRQRTKAMAVGRAWTRKNPGCMSGTYAIMHANPASSRTRSKHAHLIASGQFEEAAKLWRRSMKRRNPGIQQGDRVHVSAPHWGKPFNGTVVGVYAGHPDGTPYLVARSPTSGASYYAAHELRPLKKSGRAPKAALYYASFTEGRNRYYAETPDYATAVKWTQRWESHPSKSRISVSATRPKNAQRIPMYGE